MGGADYEVFPGQAFNGVLEYWSAGKSESFNCNLN